MHVVFLLVLLVCGCLLFVRSFVRSFVCCLLLLVRLSVCLFVRLFVRSLVCLQRSQSVCLELAGWFADGLRFCEVIVCLFVCLLVCLFVVFWGWLVCVFVCLFVCLFV